MIDATSLLREVVPKPWGFEYELLVSRDIRLLHLYINPGQKTSLHCHPTKKSAMLFLHGSGTVHFLNSNQPFFPGNRLILRPSLFHQIEAGPEHVEVLEVESPPNKDDLVRLEDAHGRRGSAYETSILRDLPDTVWDFRLSEPQKNRLGESVSSRFEVYDTLIDSPEFITSSVFEAISVSVVLSGRLVTTDGYQILGPSDVIPSATLTRLMGKFELDGNLRLLAFGNVRSTG